MINEEMRKELTRLLMESYDAGVKDTLNAAMEATEKAVESAIAAEREACAKVCEEQPYRAASAQKAADAIRARGEGK